MTKKADLYRTMDRLASAKRELIDALKAAEDDHIPQRFIRQFDIIIGRTEALQNRLREHSAA
jgi:hypothetical protein